MTTEQGMIGLESFVEERNSITVTESGNNDSRRLE